MNQLLKLLIRQHFRYFKIKEPEVKKYHLDHCFFCFEAFLFVKNSFCVQIASLLHEMTQHGFFLETLCLGVAVIGILSRSFFLIMVLILFKFGDSMITL
jgi:hypothetical protein